VDAVGNLPADELNLDDLDYFEEEDEDWGIGRGLSMYPTSTCVPRNVCPLYGYLAF
jgi:hypothetical protein